MPEDKEGQVWDEIKRRAREVVKNGEIELTLKIHDCKIVGGEVTKERIKIG